MARAERLRNTPQAILELLLPRPKEERMPCAPPRRAKGTGPAPLPWLIRPLPTAAFLPYIPAGCLSWNFIPI